MIVKIGRCLVHFLLSAPNSEQVLKTSLEGVKDKLLFLSSVLQRRRITINKYLEGCGSKWGMERRDVGTLRDRQTE